ICNGKFFFNERVSYSSDLFTSFSTVSPSDSYFFILFSSCLKMYSVQISAIKVTIAIMILSHIVIFIPSIIFPSQYIVYYMEGNMSVILSTYTNKEPSCLFPQDGFLLID